ncbi:unnamed protein product [Calicophoron daubneyi]|uniref:Importin N-terminal domain-containing protein n=1 Tax=Calicophoron daubneyi TaxID=300641 RepID=A0AAV2TX47_CALDB
MLLDLINLLNSAASDDPNVVIAAGQQLVMFTSGDSSPQFCVTLSSAVFSCEQTQLTDNGRFVGLIHLKNMITDGRVWRGLDQPDRELVKTHLLNYLASGQNTDENLNRVEQIPRIGPCTCSILCRLIKTEWMSSDWSDSVWGDLIKWCAWRSLRLSLRAISSFRLPARRRAFLTLIRRLLPRLVTIWSEVETSSKNSVIECSTRLTHLLYTCLTGPGIHPQSGPFLLDGELAWLMSTLLAHSFSLLSRLCLADTELGSVYCPKRLMRRLTKLILAAMLSASPDVRGEFVVFILSHSVGLLCSVSGHSSVSINNQENGGGCLDKKSAVWLLGLLYGLLCTPKAGYGPPLILSENGISELIKWLWTPFDSEYSSTPLGNNLGRLMIALIRTQFMLSDVEVTSLATDPESCLSTGGLCRSVELSTQEPSSVTSECVSALSIWDVDGQAQELAGMELQSLLGLQGADQQLPAVDPCRQLIELMWTLLIRQYGSETEAMFFYLIEELHASCSSAVQFEAIMRIVQLCLPYAGSNVEWITLTDNLLTNGLHFVSSRLPVSDEPANVRQACELIVLITRLLCLFVRYAMHCTSPDHSLDAQCDVVLSHLIGYLNANKTSAIQVGPKSYALCVRLGAAHSLAWLLAQPTFPSKSLTPYLNPLFNGLFTLIQDASECETRVYVLGVLCNLIETADLIGDPELATSMLGLLDQLWKLEDQGSALRAHVLDAVSILLSALNASEEVEDRLISFRSSLQAPVASLIRTSLEQVHNNGSGSEALFEPALRLWNSLVTGEGAMWSSAMGSLMSLLVGRQTNPDSGGDDGGASRTLSEPLLNRLDTSEQAQIFFSIARGSLVLAYKDGPQTLANFLQRWTEPFWSVILLESAPQPVASSTAAGSMNVHGLLNYLFSHAATVGDEDNQQDDESQCRLEELKLLTLWMSIYLDQMICAPGPSSSSLIAFQFPPSFAGLLLLAGRQCLTRAPIDAHEDICPKATQLGLGLLARLAVSPDRWLSLLQLIRCVHTSEDAPDQVNTILSSFADTKPFSLTNISQDELTRLLAYVLERWLARADSLTEAIDRRCFAVVSLMALRYCACDRSSDAAAAAATDPSSLDVLAVHDTVHAKWLEPVVNLCIQVLFDEDRVHSDAGSQLYSSHPSVLATRDGLKCRMRSEFAAWEDRVGGPYYADALFRCHVDPVLRSQLHSQLSD